MGPAPRNVFVFITPVVDPTPWRVWVSVQGSDQGLGGPVVNPSLFTSSLWPQFPHLLNRPKNGLHFSCACKVLNPSHILFFLGSSALRVWGRAGEAGLCLLLLRRAHGLSFWGLEHTWHMGGCHPWWLCH